MIQIVVLEQALREEQGRRGRLERELAEAKDEAAAQAAELEVHRTDIWSLEEFKQALDAVSRSGSEFVIQVDRRIRTPLNGLLGMVELLLSCELTDEGREYASRARNSGQELLSILNDVLDYCRLDAAHVELSPSAIEATPLLADAATVARERLGEKPVEVSVEVDERLPAFILGDETHLRRVLTHLVDNAARFTEVGRLELALRLVGKGEDAYVQLSVTDTGVGIAPENLTRACQAFESSGREAGRGMGLALVRRLVDLMGGTFRLDSELGRGTSVQVSFPLDRAIAPEVKEATAAETDVGTEVAQVLVAEDNEVNQKVAEGFLKMIGCEVEVAENGLAVIERLGKGEYDLVLMDCMMPELNGYETTKHIRRGQAGEANASIPIIAMTADGSSGARQSCLRAGMDDYLTKPVRIDRLRAMLRTWLPPSLRPPAE